MYASSSSLSALVAGHSACDLRLVRDLLKRIGMSRIDEAPDGKAALALIAVNPPDLVVVDWDIPAGPADAIVRAARKEGEAGPRILVTMARPTRGAVEALVALKVDSIVATPFSPRIFLDRVPPLEMDRKGTAVEEAGGPS